jgi:hypothetical protein
VAYFTVEYSKPLSLVGTNTKRRSAAGKVSFKGIWQTKMTVVERGGWRYCEEDANREAIQRGKNYSSRHLPGLGPKATTWRD